MQALQDKRCYGTLAGLENFQTELLGKQMHSMEAVLAELQDSLYAPLSQLLSQVSTRSMHEGFVGLRDSDRSIRERLPGRAGWVVIYLQGRCFWGRYSSRERTLGSGKRG
jgi:hypothetical protein